MTTHESEVPNFEQIFNSAPVSYIVVNREFQIVAATDLFLESSGRKRNDILGKIITDEFGDIPDNPDANGTEVLRRALQRVLDEKTGHVLPI